MKTKLAPLIFVLILLALPAPARADGIIIPDPPICDRAPCPPFPRPLPMEQLVIRNHRVSVTIQDQVAVTHVDQVFYNPNDWTIEGTYVFPIPADAAVNTFTLWIDGKPVQGEVLDADQARQIYEEIVRTMRDPALLEYAGQGAMQARIFPIPPQGERRVELEYTQALSAENGLVRYVYPLNTEKFSALPLEEVSINLDVVASSPIRAVYSPSHQVAVSREDDYHVRAGYEDEDVLPDADFALYYSLGESQAFHLLTYRDPSDPDDPDGFFLLMLAPRVNQETASIPKDVILVLDRSGSMEGEKFRQAQEALGYILRYLNPEDRFNIITFSTGVDSYAQKMRPATEANEAIPWVDRLSAEGSTDINRALLEAASVADNDRPVYLIFLTDGLPTEGVLDSQQILDNLASAAYSNLRLFAFGVGYDVDTFLLDSLAQAHHGSSTYVMPGERLDEILSGFYARISTPVLTNLSLEFGDLGIYDLYPDPLPDLFLGSQIIGVGRYRQGGMVDVILRGEVNGDIQTFRYPLQAFTSESRRDATLAVLPRLWATRKIGHLLNRVRLKGPDQETVDQIVRLSIRYGIVTPYTSYLVTETPLGAEEQERIAAEQFDQMQAMATAPASGRAAVEKAAGQGGLAGADSAAAPPVESADLVKIVGSRTYLYREGIWSDTAYDPRAMQTVKVSFLSDEYFALARSRPELAAAFALGEKVIAVSEGIVYEVVPANVPSEPVKIPATLTPEPAEDGLNPAPSSHDPSEGPTRPPASTPASATLPCVGGLLPGILLPLGLIFIARCRVNR